MKNAIIFGRVGILSENLAEKFSAAKAEKAAKAAKETAKKAAAYEAARRRFVAVYEAAAAANYELWLRRQQLTAKLKAFVDGGCKVAVTKAYLHHDIVVADGRDVFIINPTKEDVKDSNVELTYPIAGDNIGCSFKKSGKKPIRLATAADIKAVPGLGDKTAERVLATIKAGESDPAVYAKACGNRARFDALCAAFVFPADELVNVTKKQRQDFAAQVIRNQLDNRSIKIEKIVLDGDGNDSHAEIMAYGMNRLTRRYFDEAVQAGSFSVLSKDVNMVYNNVVSSDCVKQPFSAEMVLMDLKNVPAAMVEDIRDNHLRLQIAPDGSWYAWISMVTPAGSKLHQVFELNGMRRWFTDADPECSDKDEIKAIWRKGGEFREYGCIYAGPSNQRQVNCVLFRVHDGEDHAAFMARMRSDMDYLTSGLVSTLEEMVKVRKGLNVQKLFKLNSRISLAFTPMTPSMGASAFAYYNGKFGNTGFADGQWIVNAEEVAAYFGVPSVEGLALQSRIIDGIIAKGMAIPMNGKDIAITLAEYGKKQRVSYKEFRNLWIAGKLKKDMMYLIGEGAPSYVFDENTLKAVSSTPDADKGFVLNILAVRCATAGKLNKQDAACMQHLEGFGEFIHDLGKEYIDDEIGKLEAILSGELSDKTVVNPDSYYPQLIADLCPSYVAHDKDLFEANVKDSARRLINAISNYSFPLGEDDKYCYLQSDYADMLSRKGLRVLNDDEVYMPGVKDGREVVLTRNPKTDNKEYFLAVTVDLGTIKARVELLEGVSDAWKAMVTRLFENASDALVITPATAKVSASLGGSDFDGDGCTAHFNTRFVAIQAQEPQGSSDIPKAPKTDVVVEEYNVDVMQNMMIDGIFGYKDENGMRVAPTSVGSMANHATLIQALRVKDDDYLESVLKYNGRIIDKMGYVKGNEPYVRRFTSNDVRITDKDVIAATESFYNSDRSVESFRAALEDASREGSSVVGRGIDMNKNRDHVTTGYLAFLEKRDLNNEVVPKCRNIGHRYVCKDTVKYEAVFKRFDDKETGVSRVNLELKSSESLSSKVRYVDSKLTVIREELLAYAESKINELFDLSSEIVAPESVQKFDAMNLAKGRVDMADLNIVGMAYNALMGNDGLQTEEKNDVRATVAREIRSLFDKSATPGIRFFAMRKASTLRNGGHSSFQFVLKEEFVAGVLWTASEENFPTNTMVGYKALVRDSQSVEVGEIVTIENGRSVYGDSDVVTDRTVNGVFRLAHIGNSFYLVKDAKEFFVAPKAVETMAEKADRHSRKDARLVSDENDVVFVLKDFDPTKPVNDFNKKFDIARQPKYATIQIWDKFQGLILSDDLRDRWDIVVANDGYGHISKTRLNKALAYNGVKIAAFYQYTREDGHVITIATGKFVERFDRKTGEHMPMPKMGNKKAQA